LIIEKFLAPPQTKSIDSTLSFEDFKSGLHSWDEQTTTSPSGRHLGHYKVLLIDMEDPEDVTPTIIDTISPNTDSKATTILKVY
jgi:hypothetical protein